MAEASPKLSAESQASFQRDGFVVLRQFISDQALVELQANVRRFVRDIVPNLAPEEVFYEDKRDPSTLKQIQRMGDHDDWFGRFLRESALRRVAEELLDGQVVPKNLQYFNKPPGIGRPTPPHQDGFYFMLEPCEAITMWLALSEVDEENGCVRYLAGSHRGGLRDHVRTDTLGFSQGLKDYPAELRQQEIALPALPGDLLVHHALTVHRADGNRSSSRSRQALGLVYYGARARVDTEAHATYQKRLAAEMKAQGKI